MSENKERINELAALIEGLREKKGRVIVALDGRCGSGKSSLAAALSERLDCNVLHMDDFFLRPEQRTEARLAIPGENIDHERFLEELLIPLSRGEKLRFRPYDCSEGALGPVRELPEKAVTLVEGTYSCHERLRDYYDLRIFVTTGSGEQLRRIKERNGEEMARRFEEHWIPLEEMYFEACKVQEICEIVYET